MEKYALGNDVVKVDPVGVLNHLRARHPERLYRSSEIARELIEKIKIATGISIYLSNEDISRRLRDSGRAKMLRGKTERGWVDIEEPVSLKELGISTPIY